MAIVEWILLLIVFPVVAWLARKAARRPSRRLQPDDVAYLTARLPWIERLGPEQRRRWAAHVEDLLARLAFEGCRGFEVDDRMKLLVAAQAALLVAGRSGRPFRKLSSVLLYPAGFRVKTASDLGPHAWLEGEEERIGESWERGTVILSWEDADPSLRDPDLAGNLVYHEFAHQLDAENGEDDGVPELDPAERADWQRVMKREYLSLKKAAGRREDPFIDPYGAENPAEFFAVVTEAFFDEGWELRERHPELYRVLKAYFRVDGASLL